MKVLSVLCLWILATVAVAAPARSPSKRAPAKAPVRKAAPKAAPSKGRTAARAAAPKASRKSAARRTTSRRAAPARPYVQSAPTPERYREIQQALAAKGYLKTEPNGQWNAESVDAMRRFQQDQNLTVTGKLDSLSLIALGLGPKRTTTAQVRPQ